MDYSIKELNKYWISKNLVYEVLKHPLPFSKTFVKNKRIFNETDLGLFKFYKTHDLEETLSKYRKDSGISENKTVLKLFLNEENTQTDNLEKTTNNDLEIAIKQFSEKETVLKTELEQKNHIIDIKEQQLQKYALLKTEEQKEKQEWIKKYEAVTEQKNQWVQKFYALKTYLIVFVILFVLSTTALLFKLVYM